MCALRVQGLGFRVGFLGFECREPFWASYDRFDQGFVTQDYDFFCFFFGGGRGVKV